MQLHVDTPPPRTERVVPHAWSPVVRAGDLLVTPGPVVVPRDWWSWAGAHGGLLVALAAADATSLAPDAPLRSSSAQLLRPVTGPLTLVSTPVHAGRRLTTVRTEGTVGGRTALVVHSTFGAAATGPGTAAVAPLPTPLVHRPEDLAPFVPPTDLVPFAAHLDIRPTDDVLPLAGAPTARLTAWVRLDEPGAPGPLRTTLLADALAPSLYAVLREPAPIPTVELSIHHRGAATTTATGTTTGATTGTAGTTADPDDPWLLVRARTDRSSEGWVTETIDLWDRAGAHVATSRQLRLVAA